MQADLTSLRRFQVDYEEVEHVEQRIILTCYNCPGQDNPTYLPHGGYRGYFEGKCCWYTQGTRHETEGDRPLGCSSMVTLGGNTTSGYLVSLRNHVVLPREKQQRDMLHPVPQLPLRLFPSLVLRGKWVLCAVLNPC